MAIFRAVFACFISETTSRISMKFSAQSLHKKLSGSCKCGLYNFGINPTLHEDPMEMSK
jgi:hypothetical protein